MLSKFFRKGTASGITFGLTFGLTFAMGIAYCGIANATPTSWTNASGSEADFSYSNGSDDNGVAGSPNTVSDGFQFTVDHFKAESTGGGSDEVSEDIHVTLTPNPGLRISSISAMLTGDYSVLSVLQPADSSYTASLDAVKLSGGAHVTNSISNDFTTSAAPISDGVTLNIPSTTTGPIDLSFSVEVGADSDAASAATTELKYLQLNVATSQAPPAVPLPDAVATFPLGAMVAGWARKRFAR